ncbi:MAG: OsmC family protein [Chloroflexota bacterium]
MSIQTVVNGVDTSKIQTLCGRIAEEPAKGDTVWKANVTWKQGFRNEIQVRDLPPTYADEPEMLGGSNTSANPVEQVLGALGSCLAIGYVANASVRGIELQDLRLELEGHIDLPVFLGMKEGNAGYPEVTVRTHITSTASPEALRELHQQVLKTSPVGNTIQRTVGLSAELITG